MADVEYIDNTFITIRNRKKTRVWACCSGTYPKHREDCPGTPASNPIPR